MPICIHVAATADSESSDGAMTPRLIPWYWMQIRPRVFVRCVLSSRSMALSDRHRERHAGSDWKPKPFLKGI